MNTNNSSNNSNKCSIEVFDTIKTANVQPLVTMLMDSDMNYTIAHNFIVNGYKLHLDDMARFQIKQIVKEKYSKYRFVSNPGKKIQKEINFPSPKEAPKWIRQRSEHINILIRTLILQLRHSKNIDQDLFQLLGDSKWDSMFPTMLSVFPKGSFAGGIKKEWEEDYHQKVEDLMIIDNCPVEVVNVA